MSREKEYAVKSDGRRVQSAVRSLCSFYKKECYRLARERILFRENLQGSKLEKAMSENRTEQLNLKNGFESSSLRRFVMTRNGKGTNIEQRSYSQSLSSSELLRTEGTSSASKVTARSIYGYAAKFNKLSEDLGGFREQIHPKAFDNALRVSDIRCLFNHDSNFLFGRTSAATLEVTTDKIGLRFECYLLPFDAASYSLARRIDRRDVTGCSFSFIPAKDRWEWAKKPGDIDVRIIEKISRLYDVCPCTYPAYPDTSVGVTFEKVKSSSRSEGDIEYGPVTDDELYEAEYRRLSQPVSPGRQREIMRKYRLAGRIRNRCTIEA